MVKTILTRFCPLRKDKDICSEIRNRVSSLASDRSSVYGMAFQPTSPICIGRDLIIIGFLTLHYISTESNILAGFTFRPTDMPFHLYIPYIHMLHMRSNICICHAFTSFSAWSNATLFHE